MRKGEMLKQSHNDCNGKSIYMYGKAVEIGFKLLREQGMSTRVIDVKLSQQQTKAGDCVL